MKDLEFVHKDSSLDLRWESEGCVSMVGIFSEDQVALLSSQEKKCYACGGAGHLMVNCTMSKEKLRYVVLPCLPTVGHGKGASAGPPLILPGSSLI